ncbi:MAG: hypothetical protein U0237_01015 [Thermoleophilia bacterium]
MPPARPLHLLAMAALLAVPALGAAADPVVTTPRGAADIRMAAAPAGPRALAYWTVVSGGTQRLEAAERGADGTWAAPVVLGTASGDGDPIIALNARGDAVLAWRLRDRSGQRLLAATRAPGGRWSALRAVATAPRLGPPELNLASDGTAIVGWGQVRNLDTRTPVRASVRRPGGAFGAPVRVGTAPAASSALENIEFRALPGGRAVAAWSDKGETSVARLRGGRWGTPSVLRVTRIGVWAVRVSADGTAFTTWFVPRRGAKGNFNAVPGRMFGAVAPPGRGWARPRAISGPTAVIGVENLFYSGTVLYLDDAGHAYAGWIRFPRLPGGGPRATVGAGGAAIVATGGPGGWGTGRRVSAAGSNVAALDLDGGGSGATVAWIEAVPGGDNELAFASTSDTSGTRWDAPLPLFARGRLALREPGTVSVVQAPDRSATVALGFRNPVAYRPAAAAAWRLVTLEEPGVFGAPEPDAVFIASDGAAYAAQRRYTGTAYAEVTSVGVLVPVPGA